MKKVSLWELFITFFKIGAFTFGGGYAMISILQDELVTRKKWISMSDFFDMVVISESTPGVIAVNMATSVGYRTKGVLGAIIATSGVVLPSFVIISLLSYVLAAFQENTWYKSAFAGIRVCVIVLIFNAFTNMSKHLKKDIFSIVVIIATFCLVTFVDLQAINFDVVYLIVIGGIIGVVITLLKDKQNNDTTSLQQTDTSFSQKEDEQ